MTPDDWKRLFDSWANEGATRQNFYVVAEPTEWEIQRDSTIYGDSLYCEEIGIRYP